MFGQSKRSLKNIIYTLRKKRRMKVKRVNLKKPKRKSNLSSFIDVPDSNEDKILKQKKDFSANEISKADKKIKKKTHGNEFLTSQEIDNGFAKKAMPLKKQSNKKHLFTSLISKSALFFANIKRTVGNSVSKFAENEKSTGKKISKRVYWFAGAGFLLIAVLLAALLVPWGSGEEAKPVQMAEETPAETTDNLAVFAENQQSVDATPEVEAAVTPIPTTQPDEPVKAEVSEPTQEPTTIPTTEPDPTPVPVVMDDLIDDFMVEADTYYNDMGYSSNYYEYTQDELYMLAQIIQIEAGGQSYEGKLAVGNVVMNRVLCRGYPGSTITAVITAPGQFAYERHKDRAPKSSAKAAARDILDNQHWVIAQNVYFFRSGSGDGDWGSHPFYKKIGGHRFYTHRYSGRNRNGQVPPALFDRTYKWPRYGCKPESRVKRIQYMLHKLGYDVSADKYFGKDTETALIEFQKSKDLEADGVAGPSTIEALIKAYGIEDYYLDFCN